MSSINNILKRLRESRIQEAQSHEYKFDIPYRLEITPESDYNPTYQYNPKQMDYLSELEDKAMEDFNEIDWTQYTGRDRRTEDCGIISMSMSFTDEYNCIITVTTNQVLGQDKIDNIISYLTGQMSDGWGEGFEQREIAEFTTQDEEWIEDEDSDEGGYYEEVDVRVSVYGQFWWSSSEAHPYQIELVGTPAEVGELTNESKQGIVSLSIDEEKLEAAMRAKGYDEEEVFEFISDVYGLEDGEDFQTGNGFELLFREATSREKIDKISKDLGENMQESAADVYDLKAQIIEEYLNGDSLSEIAHNLNITRADVKVVVDEYLASRKGNTNESKDNEGEGPTPKSPTSKYASKYKIGDKVKSKSTDKKGTIVGYTKEGMYRVRWRDENGDTLTTDGLADTNLVSESTESGGFFVIDKTDTRDGDSEKYKAKSKEEAEKKVRELIYTGSDEDKISIAPLEESLTSQEQEILDYWESMSAEEVAQSIEFWEESPDNRKAVIDNYSTYYDLPAETTKKLMDKIIKKYKKVDEATSPRSYISVEYTYSGDEVSDYLGHVKVRTDKEDVALKAARKYAMSKHPEDEPRHFNISKDEYTNVDVVDEYGDYLTTLEENKESDKSRVAKALVNALDDEGIMRAIGSLSSINPSLYKKASAAIQKGDKSLPYIAKEISDELMTESKSSESISTEIESKVKKALKDFMMSPSIGFPEDEVDEYSRLEVKSGVNDEGDKFIKVEVRAELSYGALSDLCDTLNPIVAEYDKDSYFEPEQPGIIVAYLFI